MIKILACQGVSAAPRKRTTLDRLVSRLYVLKFVNTSPLTVLNLADRLREKGVEANIRSLRPILRSLIIAKAITAELVEGSGRVYCITDQGRAELDAILAKFEMLTNDGGLIATTHTLQL